MHRVAEPGPVQRVPHLARLDQPGQALAGGYGTVETGFLLELRDRLHGASGFPRPSRLNRCYLGSGAWLSSRQEDLMAKHDTDPVLRQLVRAINESENAAVPVTVSVHGTQLTGALIGERVYFGELVGQ